MWYTKIQLHVNRVNKNTDLCTVAPPFNKHHISECMGNIADPTTNSLHLIQ